MLEEAEATTLATLGALGGRPPEATGINQDKIDTPRDGVGTSGPTKDPKTGGKHAEVTTEVPNTAGKPPKEPKIGGKPPEVPNSAGKPPKVPKVTEAPISKNDGRE